MNKLSTQHTRPPAKSYQSGLLADLDGQQAPGSTLIDQLLILDDSANFTSRSPIKNNARRPDTFQASSKEKSYGKFSSAKPKDPTSPNKVKTKTSLQSNGDNCINLDSKVRLEHKYEQALQKLTELKCHYEARKSQKYTILNHKSSSSKHSPPSPVPHPA